MNNADRKLSNDSHYQADKASLTSAFNHMLESQRRLEASPAYKQELTEYQQRLAKLKAASDARMSKRRVSW